MHAIQSHILKYLTFTEGARYSELRPGDIESNRFIYHLQKLTRDGVIEKMAQTYRLTANGKRYVGKLSLRTFQPRFQPKIVTTLICQNPRGEYLIMTSKKQPFLGLSSFPHGKVHFGETIVQAAHRELREKTGLTAQLTHCGDAYLSIRQRGELVSHMLCHVFKATKSSGELRPDFRTHTVRWRSLGNNLKEFVPGFLELNALRMKSKEKFFAELLV